jgi:lysophospholipase L1-like esterase
MVKPGRILLLLLMVNVLLGAIIYFIPTGKLTLTDGFDIHFLSLDNFLHPKEIKYADITNIINSEQNLNTDSLLNLSKGKQGDTAHSSLTDSTLNGAQIKGTTAAELLAIKYKIELPENQPNPLAPFFNELDALKTNPHLVRMVHYGDSQIEGDRISGTLRNKMQAQFGGCGAGTVPVFDVADIRSSVKLACSDNWKKYALYGGMYRGAGTKHYGTQASIYRYGQWTDSLGNLVGDSKNAWASFNKGFGGYANTSRFQDFTIYYGNAVKPTTVKISYGHKQLYKDTLPATTSLGIKTFPLDTSLAKELRVDFNGASPDVYGFGFDCKSGVAVDNIPMRGSSGLDFSREDFGFLAQELKALNTRFIILQYGVNVVPNVVSSYDFYERSFYKQLKAFKDNLPGVCILVIGVSDISTKENGQYVSYPNIPKIRDAQRKAAFAAGCAYWDLYSAMGGANSMPSWVNAKPSLAEKDFTHFNAKGAKIIGEMLYNALMSEYVAYKNHAIN